MWELVWVHKIVSRWTCSELITHECSGVYNVGTELKSMYNLAKLSNKTVQPILMGDVDPTTPTNTSMNLSKLHKEIESWLGL